jgi:hypothetical protein
MDERATTTRCANCLVLEARIAELEARLAKLEKNSRSSCKPPSSDVVKPPADQRRLRGRKKRKRGAQPGHPKHERPAFPPEQIDKTRDYLLERCPDCGGELELPKQPASVVQQVEIVTRPTRITEHRIRTCRCQKCRRDFTARIPPKVRKAGLVGPRLTALVAYLIDRRVTQGSRSPEGRKWLERIWTAIATCAQHGQSLFHFLNGSVHAYLAQQPPPSLSFGTS